MINTTPRNEKNPNLEVIPESNNNEASISIKHNEELKQLKEDKKKLKKELITKKNEVNTLNKVLEEIEKDIKSKYVPLTEARKITYKALRKGSATQNLINLMESNNINYKLKKKTMNMLMVNAFGDTNYQKNRYPDILKYTDSHLKLFRQEQLLLLAENERLVVQMKDLKKQILDNKIENLKNNEKSLFTSTRNINNLGSKNSIEDSFVELDADLVEKNFINLIKNIKIAQLKLLFYAFRKLINNVYYNSHPLYNNMNNAYSIKWGMNILSNILKKKKYTILYNIFYKLYNYNVNNLLYNSKNVHQINKYENFNYLNNEKNENNVSHFVYKPYYYDDLPSASYDIRKKKLPISNVKKGFNVKSLIYDEKPINEHFLYQNIKNNTKKLHKNDYFDLRAVKKYVDS